MQAGCPHDGRLLNWLEGHNACLNRGMAKTKQNQSNPVERVAESFRHTGRASGDTGGPDDNGPDVDYSDMGNINVGGDRSDDTRRGKREDPNR